MKNDPRSCEHNLCNCLVEVVNFLQASNCKLGFDSDPQLHDLKCLVSELFHFVF